jgi:uncharacterized membrane protein
MYNKHYRKWIIRMPIGFFLVSVGILVIMYAANKQASDEWLIWGIISMTVINGGLALLGNAYTHKIKSDLMRKQRVKEKNSAPEEF